MKRCGFAVVALIVLWSVTAAAAFELARLRANELKPRIVGISGERVAFVRLRDREAARTESSQEYVTPDLVAELVVGPLPPASGDVVLVAELGPVCNVGDGESIRRCDEDGGGPRRAARANRWLAAGAFRAPERLLGVTVALVETESEVDPPALFLTGEPSVPLVGLAQAVTGYATISDAVQTAQGDLLVLWAGQERWDAALARTPWPPGVPRGPRVSKTTLAPGQGGPGSGTARVGAMRPHVVGWSPNGDAIVYVTSVSWIGSSTELALVVHDVRRDSPAGLLSLGWFPWVVDDLTAPMSLPTSVTPLDAPFTKARRAEADQWLRAQGFLPSPPARGRLIGSWEDESRDHEGCFGYDYHAVSFVRVGRPVTSPDGTLWALMVDVYGWQEDDYDDATDPLRHFAVMAVGNPRPIVDTAASAGPRAVSPPKAP